MTYLALAFKAMKAHDRREGLPYAAVVSVAKHGVIAAATRGGRHSSKTMAFFVLFPRRTWTRIVTTNIQ